MIFPVDVQIFSCSDVPCLISIIRSQRSLSSRQNLDDDRMTNLEEQLQLTKNSAHESERKYEEVGTGFMTLEFRSLQYV